MSQSQETDAIKKDMEQLRHDLAALAEAVKRGGQQRAQAGAEAAREKFDEVRREAASQAEHCSNHIRERPFTSVLAAFGVGLLIGKIISR
jgi:ElaB/YqjD/DUF883 family membrane-anchored ribosome-binding protein